MLAFALHGRFGDVIFTILFAASCFLALKASRLATRYAERQNNERKAEET